MDDFTECTGYSLMMRHFAVALHFNYPVFIVVVHGPEIPLLPFLLQKKKKQTKRHD